jgi:hypothetical protein
VRARLTALVLLLGACASPAGDERPAAGDPPDARGLLDRVIASFPDVPLHIRGSAVAKDRTGKTDQRINIEMSLDWRAEPAQARYTLRDAFGRPAQHLAVTWPRGGTPEYRYFEGDPLVAAPLPVLSEPIGQTDLSWMDLSLSFLWWPKARTVGSEEVKGRTCSVIDLTAPADTYRGCAGVRAWVDPTIPMLLRAAAYDPEGSPTRQLDVRSFKKIGGRWMIQDIEVVSRVSRHRTLLRVSEVRDGERAETGDGEPPAEPVDAVAPVAVEP